MHILTSVQLSNKQYMPFPNKRERENDSIQGKPEKVENNAKEEARRALEKKRSELESLQKKSQQSNPKTDRLVALFKAGYKLYPYELHYLKKHAPEMAESVLTIHSEREQSERLMKFSRTKNQTRASVMIGLSGIHQGGLRPEETLSRINQLRDAVSTYTSTDDFNKKPEYEFDSRSKQKKRYRDNKLPISVGVAFHAVSWNRMKHSYSSTKTHFKSSSRV